MIIRGSALAAALFLSQLVLAQTPAPTTRATQGEDGEEKAQVCAACHGVNGNSTNPMYPTLAGQNSRYIYLQLQDFQAGRRHDPQMDPIAATLTREEMQALADYFSKQEQARSGFKADAQKVAAGGQKSKEALCSMCHLGEFAGQNEIPRVAGQQYDYIKKQLSDFKARRRTNDAGNMTSVSATLSDADIENLAQYIANLY
jgi:cytochrome c553